ncbi:MAG TPA: hypothetical protein VMM93_08330 [Vicinamibacterales bacterium]|nr:hypothetical protein [Vicinamibacterales bacterium]
MPKTVSATRMARLVARWRDSEESGASFARRHGVAPWTFWYWCRKWSGAPPVIPVQVLKDTAEGAVEIALTSGDRVRVEAGASAALVRTVVAALRSASA